MAPSEGSLKGLDIAGLGKVAQAIPPEVYIRSIDSVIDTFEKLIAPLTETTSGLGRYIRQKFDNMVADEKALATYTLQQASDIARRRRPEGATVIREIEHPKTFIRVLEEASKETDPVLHKMWTNLLASQLVDGVCHPHFVAILAHFSPVEARLLQSLNEMETVGDHGSRYIMFCVDALRSWLTSSADEHPKPWNTSCSLLLQFGFVDVLSSKGENATTQCILYRTQVGTDFLQAVGG